MRALRLALIVLVLAVECNHVKATPAEEDKFQEYVNDLSTRVYFWCKRVDPTRAEYCQDEVVDCVLDEGKDFESWCRKDYCDTEDLIYTP